MNAVLVALGFLWMSPMQHVGNGICEKWGEHHNTGGGEFDPPLDGIKCELWRKGDRFFFHFPTMGVWRAGTMHGRIFARDA